MSITSISYSSKKKKEKKKGSDGFAHGLNMATVIDEEKKQKKLHLKTILPRCGNYTEQEMKRHK